MTHADVLRPEDAAVVRAFVCDVCTKGIPGDCLRAEEVIAVKFEYHHDDLALVACQVGRDRFGDATVQPDLGPGRNCLLEHARDLPDATFANAVAELTRWVCSAWQACAGQRVVPRGFFGPHDDLYMVDLDMGPPPRRVDFDRWTDEPAR